jgi:deoxyribodipyrimidine photolyase
VNTVVVLFTRDLRVHDNPALSHAARHADRVVPLFVTDPSVRAEVNRRRFLVESLADLRSSLRARGADLILRTGSVVDEAVRLAREVGAPAEFVRQLCWRDFFHQLTAAYPRLTSEPIRPVAEDWHTDPDALQAWQEGSTGVPIVDAGMRQLRQEGWLPNRARLIVASYLTRDLRLDWRDGARWFAEWLLDGDIPNNYGNWQWVAGTGTDTKPYRRFNPDRQARRFDPDGGYVRQFCGVAQIT